MSSRRDYEWDGRAPFYPAIGYDKDAEFMEKYRSFLLRDGLESNSDHGDESSEDESSDERADDGDDGVGIPRKVVYSPPLYDREDHRHPARAADQRVTSLALCCDELKAAITSSFLPRRMRSRETPFEIIADDTLSNIIRNRKENAAVKEAMRSTVIIEARIAGLGKDAPIRELEVPGNLLLAGLHDRVLCSAFGWTRGYHDYRFYVPPTGYKDGIPQFPYLDVLFGAAGGGVSMIRNHGFYDTLRCDPQNGGAASVQDTNVCVADLLQGEGQEIRHVLGQSGWKTVLKVKEIAPKNRDSKYLFGWIRSGSGPNLPENIVMSIDFSSEYCVDEYDCGGPKAFALAHEMLRRADRNEDRNGWMRDYVHRETRRQSSDFDLSRSFHLAAAQQALKKAKRGELTPNPEYSNDWMFSLMGNGPVVPQGTTVSSTGELLIPAGVCNYCNVTAEQLHENLKVCSRCKNVQYCKRECQVNDWKRHKELCIPKKKK